MKLIKRKKPKPKVEKPKVEKPKVEKPQKPQYCSVIKNRLPFPIECTTNMKLGVKECLKCEKRLEYSIWKSGGYNDLILKYNR